MTPDRFTPPMSADAAIEDRTTRPVTVLIARPGIAGGVDEAAAYLATELAQHRDVRVITAITRGDRAVLAPLWFAWSLLWVPIAARRHRPSVVHLNMSLRSGALRKAILARILRWLHIPHVIQLHSSGFLPYLRDARPRSRALIESSLRHATRIGYLREDHRAFLIEELLIDPDRVMLIPNGIPLGSEPLAATDDVAMASAATDRMARVLFLGKMVPAKGFDEFIAVLNDPLIAGLEWEAIVAGHGDFERASAVVRGTAMADRIEVRGWQDRAEADELLRWADIFVLPSHDEAMSMSLLEAMAHGCACIATDVGAHRWVLEDGADGMVIPPRDHTAFVEALANLLNDPAQRHAFAVAGTRRVRSHFTLHAVAQQWAAVYRAAVYGSVH